MLREFFGLKDFRQLVGWMRLALRTIRGASRGLAAVTWGFALLIGLVPVAMSIAMANIIGAAPGVTVFGLDSPEGRRLVTATWFYVGFLTLQGLVVATSGAVVPWIGRQLDGRIRERVMSAALRPNGIQHLEDPTMRSALEQARSAAPSSGMTPGAIAGVVPRVIAYRINLLAYLVGLTYIAWPIGLAFLLVTLKSQDEMQKGVWRVAGAGGAIAPPAIAYQLELATGADAGKEVRVFGLGSWIVGRFTSGMLDHIHGVWSKRRDFTPALIATLAVSAVVTVVSLNAIGIAATQGRIGVGEVVFAVVAIMALSPAFNQDDMPLAFAATTIETIEAAERIVADAALAVGGSEPAAGLPAVSIRFEGVSFRYPGTDTDVLRDLDFELRAGERLALVGINGAGKTTLVKLLCGLYEPTVGAIRVDGARSLRELDPVSWRSRLAVLFQDFTQYELSARDNVRFGAVAWDPPDLDAALEHAAAQATISGAIAALPAGWASPLAPGYPDGASLSGGQWQRVAVARALFAVEAGARVLVLDEPTANLDVRAEADLYESLLALTSGALADETRGKLTTLLISHRFSTVRQADRILVLNDGHIAEEGTHLELVELGGMYSRMFQAQAEQFSDGNNATGEPA